MTNTTSPLHSILAKASFTGSKSERLKIHADADTSITTLSLGISSIGKLIGCGHGLGDDDLVSMGLLLNELGATVVALQNIQTVADDTMLA